MSKYDAFVYEYLTEHKQVSLEKIGTLTLEGNIPAAERDNPHPGMNHLVQFVSDKRASTSPELIDFIAARLQKNKSLVYSDVESYFEQVRQFINIGKPYIIPGVGGVFMAKTGLYEFNGSETLPTAQVNREGQTRHEPAFETSEERRTDLRATQQNMLKYIALIVGVLLLAGVGYFIYDFVSDVKADNAAIVTDTAVVSPVTNDSFAAVTPLPPPAADSITMKVAIFQTPYSWTSSRKADSLTKAGFIASVDSVGVGRARRYRISIEGRVATMSDTLNLKDSLSRMFKKQVTLLPQ